MGPPRQNPSLRLQPKLEARDVRRNKNLALLIDAKTEPIRGAGRPEA